MEITWIATAVYWGEGEVLLGLADRVRSEALRLAEQGRREQCAEMRNDDNTIPLHYMATPALATRVLHNWSDGSREVAVSLTYDGPSTPDSSVTLGRRLDAGWILAVGLSAARQDELHRLLCSRQNHDFAALYRLIRRLARTQSSPGPGAVRNRTTEC